MAKRLRHTLSLEFRKVPLVSVIIPTFNRSEMVCDAIRSVLRQSYRNFELIVVDDGSRDLTEAMVHECFFEEPENKNLHYFRLSNSGVSRARNFGIEQAKGDLIAFLDSDDLWKPDKLLRQVEYLAENSEAQVVYTDEVWFRNGRHLNQKKVHAKRGGRIFERCLPLCIISPSSVAIRRPVLEEIGGFDEDLPVCEDYDLWLRIAVKYEIHYLPEKLIIKRGGHEDQLSKRHWGMDRFRIYALRKVIGDSRLPGSDRTKALEELRKKCEILANGSFKRGRTLAGLYYKLLPRFSGIRMTVSRWQ